MSLTIGARKGFTLIELLIVIAIIGILASVILIGLGGAQRGGRDARRIADLQQIQNGLQLYYNANSKYPATPTGGEVGDLTLPGVPSLPKDPDGSQYTYQQLGLGRGYVLIATLEDAGNNKGGVEGDISDGGVGADGKPTVTTPVSDCGGTKYCVQF